MESKATAAEERITCSATKDEALQNAILATEIYMKAIKLASSEIERDKLKMRCMEVLARAEEIKQMNTWRLPVSHNQTVSRGRRLKAPSSLRTLSTREEVILLEGSKLHGSIFPPWQSDPREEAFEKIGDGVFYADTSELKLSISQHQLFVGWKRPREIFHNQTTKKGIEGAFIEPTMFTTKPTDLVQDVTTDCSVVASFCAAMARAENGFENILYPIFYPRDTKDGRPLASKNGKYIFRFNFNGGFRKVTIDDRLPESNSSRTLFVIDRGNPGLLWPALLEKAYLKVRGGYDFPGSNSGTDLWVLTGWLPEQILLQSGEVLTQEVWNRVFKSYGFGDVIVTMGTGRLSGQEEDSLGLAGEHDYAVLDMKEFGGERLLLVKNPWRNGVTWKGSRSSAVNDETRSNAWMMDKLEGANMPNNPPGTFWIVFEEVVQYFESLYLNWNPGLFRYREDHHFTWTIPPVSSSSCFIHNPQFSIRSTSGGPVWVLLSRHFSTEECDILREPPRVEAPTRNLLGFISLYLFGAGGRRIHLGENAILRGPFVDSPQTLARLEIPPMTCYTLVVAQQTLPLPKYSFTLSTYSRDKVTVDNAVNPYPHSTTVSGAWTSRTAGGNACATSYPSNPQFKISIPAPMDLVLILETAQLDLAVHVKILWAGGARVSTVTARDILGESGEYRRGSAMASIVNVPAGGYTIVCSTFEPGQTGCFALRVESTLPCEVRPLAGEDRGLFSFYLPVVLLQDGVDRMLAPIMVSRMTRVRAIARHIDTAVSHDGQPSARTLLRIALERGQGPHKTVLATSGGGGFSDAPSGVRTVDVDIGPHIEDGGGLWLVVERLGGGVALSKIQVEILSEASVEAGSWETGDG